MMARRVVITAIGVVSSLGSNAAAILDSLRKGSASFARPEFDNEVVISPVGGFGIRDYIGRFKNSRYLTRGTQFSVAAAMDAVSGSGMGPGLPRDCGLFVGAGPNLDISGEFPEFHRGSMDGEELAALWMLRFLPNTAASAIAQLAGIHGENGTITTACAASLQAVGEAYRKIKDGYLDMALAGGGDSRLHPGGILAYRKAQALCTGPLDPQQASRPFDMDRKGFVPGEGGAFFILEELNHARSRGAAIQGELCGYGASMDGQTMTAPAADGVWAEKSILAAMAEAGIGAAGVELVCAHGTGTMLNDEMESALISRVFGGHGPFVIALKSWIGHLAAACGAVELAIALACVDKGYLPEIRNLRRPCRGDINYVRSPQAASPGTVVIQNFGFGGQNCALVVKRWKE